MSSVPPHLNGLHEMADRFDVFFLDIFGLLHNGVTLYTGTIHCLEELLKSGKKICLVSNTPRMPENVVEDLYAKGLESHLYHDIVTAGYSARQELSADHQGQKVFFMGNYTPGKNNEFDGFTRDLGLIFVDDPAEADLVINAISGTTEESNKPIYEHLTRAIAHKKPMLCANPDMVVHIANNIFICAGTYAKWYEERGGDVSYHGKPYRHVYEHALEKMGNPDRSRVCIMGDALHTDIQGANRMGFAGIWVLCGIHWEELRLSEKPSHPDLDRVAETIKISPHKPIATLTEFKW
jgi:HAD superfamily hydrolase (TIGR01459 family)